MPKKLLTADEFRAAAKDGARPDAMVFRLASEESITVGDEAARTQRFVFSDDTVDLAGDVIDPKGWQTDDFKRNPVALFSHDSWSPPIGRASNVGVVGNKLMGDIEFASADVYDFADTIYRLVKAKFLKAVSVGFKPLEWNFVNDKDRPYGIDFKRQMLLEISVCCVPCNPNALSEARSAGIDTEPLIGWAERVLDEGGSIMVPKTELEALRKSAGARPKLYVQISNLITPAQAKRIKADVDAWLAKDCNDALILPEGADLKSYGQTKTEDWKCGASRDLSIDEESSWDGAAAKASIFEHAGGDDFDPEKARKGFLAYDASAPKLKGSYKLPFAKVDGGVMKAVAAGIRAAAARLPNTEISDGAKTEARAVIDHYEEKMKKSAGEGTNAGGGAVVPMGDCGRDKDMECGMKDPAECMTHAPEDKSAPPRKRKSGRTISAKNKAKLEEAMGYHDAATKCIKDVIDPPDDTEPDLDPDDDMTDPNNPNDDLDPVKRRQREARALRESLKQ